MTLFLLFISVVINIGLAFVLMRFMLRARQLDEIVNAIIDKLDVFIDYLDNAVKTPSFINSPEVKALYVNMRLMRDFFVEYIQMANDVRNIEEAKKK